MFLDLSQNIGLVLSQHWSRHIDVDYLREIMKREIMTIEFVPSIDQLANLFTKALDIARFVELS